MSGRRFCCLLLVRGELLRVFVPLPSLCWCVRAVTLAKNEATDVLLKGEVLPTGDKFLIISAPLEEADMSTIDDRKELAKMWSSTRWKKKSQNKRLDVRLFRKVEVSDDSDSDDDSDESSSDEDVAKVAAVVTPSAVLGKQARARAGADALANRARASVSPTPSLSRRGGQSGSAGAHPSSAGSSSYTSVSSYSYSQSASNVSVSVSAGWGEVSPTHDGDGGGGGSGVGGAGGTSGRTDRGSSAGSVLSAASLSGIGGAMFPWKCGELLGRGRTGHVYKAMRSDTGELIAMKVVFCYCPGLGVVRNGGVGCHEVRAQQSGPSLFAWPRPCNCCLRWAVGKQVLEVASARSQAQIMKEVEVLRTLEHEHVVRGLGYPSPQGVPWAELTAVHKFSGCCVHSGAGKVLGL